MENKYHENLTLWSKTWKIAVGTKIILVFPGDDILFIRRIILKEQRVDQIWIMPLLSRCRYIFFPVTFAQPVSNYEKTYRTVLLKQEKLMCIYFIYVVTEFKN